MRRSCNRTGKLETMLSLVMAAAWLAGCGPTGKASTANAAPTEIVSMETTVVTMSSGGGTTQEGSSVAVQRTPTVVAQAAAREAARQDSTWTSENIQANPYLFIQDQIRNCDQLKAKIEAQNITMTRLGKQAARSIEEADAMTARYTKFLDQAKAAYKEAEATGAWPVTLNGFKLDEEQLGDRIADALERIELAKKDRESGEVIVKKTEMRKAVLKAKGRELASLRLKLVQQGEEVKMNSQLAEIGDLSNVLGIMKDMMLEIDDPTQANLDDLVEDDPNAARKNAIREFLDN